MHWLGKIAGTGQVYTHAFFVVVILRSLLIDRISAVEAMVVHCIAGWVRLQDKYASQSK